MILIIKNLLLKIVENIDSGNSNITEEQAIDIIKAIRSYTDTTLLYNRTLAAKYLNCSILSFDLYRKEGKIPEGIKLAGGVKLWTKLLLDDFISKNKK